MDGSLIRWTDDSIRWSADEFRSVAEEDDPEDTNGSDDGDRVFDPFRPTKQIIFQHDFCHGRSESIHIALEGFPEDASEIYQSTGLTLWKASRHMCDEVILKYAPEWRDKAAEKQEDTQNVLELGAGVGLCSILLYRLQIPNQHIWVSDGDSETLKVLRDNVQTHLLVETHNENTRTKIHCQQLLWGKSYAEQFLQRPDTPLSFDILLAADIIYASSILKPLWETVQMLLNRKNGIFYLAFAQRDYVTVTLQDVLDTATEYGFMYKGGCTTTTRSSSTNICASSDNKNDDLLYTYQFWHKEASNES